MKESREEKRLKEIAKTFEEDVNDLDAMLWLLDELIGMGFDKTGEYQELKCYIVDKIYSKEVK